MIDRLRNLVPPDVAQQLDPRWNDFKKKNPRAGATTFLAGLHKQGVLDAGSLKEVLGQMEVDHREATDELDSTVLSGERYEMVGVLGRGAMGEVSIALDRRLNRSVAVKRMDRDTARKPESVRRFTTEARITGQLDHPGIIPVYSMEVRADGTREYAMKLIRGKTLEDLLSETRALVEARRPLDDEHSLAGRLEVFLQVCAAMHYAHARGVIHRDLKPENVMIGPFHDVVVMDWGIAKIVGTAEEPIPNLAPGQSTQTQVGIVIGTPLYMSPEQAEGENDDLDARSDQYSLGLILYELACLRQARTGRDAIEIITRAQLGEMPPLNPLPGVTVPSGIDAIVARACQADRDKRYPDVEALADDVRRFLRDEELVARRDSTMQRVRRWIGRHRGTTMAVGAGLVLMVFAVAALGILGAGVAVELSRRASAAREARVGDFVGKVTDQAHRIDTQLRQYETLLAGLAFASKEALTRPAEPQPVYLVEDYLTPGRGPEDLAPSTLYPRPVSVEFPDFVTSPGVNPDDVRPRLYQLATLARPLEDVLLMSHDPKSLTLDPVRKAGLIRSRGVPAVWSYVGVEEGILVGYPGVGEYPDDYDVRTRPWYMVSKASGARTPVWGSIDADESGLGLLFTATMGVYDDEARFLGVAAIDIAFDHVVREMLDPKDVPVPVQTWLVDADGKVVVDSSLKEVAGSLKEWSRTPFAHPEVLEADARGGTYLELSVDGQDRLFAWSRLLAVDFLYVVSAPTEDLLR